MFEQDRVLVRLQQYVLREDEILACFLAGSYGRGGQDPFSDLDVIFVYQDEPHRQAAYVRRRDIVQAVLPYVQASYSHDTQATLTHLRRLFDAYLDARAAVIRRHNLAFTPDRAFESAIQKIIQKG